MAMRRVVVTPTFAAGLGVVIAAGMALPMTKTVISYGGEPPVGGHPCPVKDCTDGSAGDGGTLAGAKPGLPLVAPTPVTRRPGPAVAPAPSTSGAPGGDGGPMPVPQPIMQFQTLRQWQSGFIEQITITDPGGAAPAGWQLRLTYGQRRIIGVWGGQWSPGSDNSILVTPSAGGGQAGGGGQGGGGQDGRGQGGGGSGGGGQGGGGGGGSTGGGRGSTGGGRGGTGGGHGGGGGTGGAGNLQVVLAVSGGPAGPPTGCSFNGRVCRTG